MDAGIQNLYLLEKLLKRLDGDQYQWWFTCSKYHTENNLFSVSFELHKLNSIGTKVAKVLDGNLFLRKNLHRFLNLTKREKEVLKMLAEGLTAPQIASQLFISLNTVKTHRQRIQQKLEIKTFKELYQYAFHFDLSD